MQSGNGSDLIETESPVALCPWEAFPYQLVSWWDMQKFSAEKFVNIGTLIHRLKEELGIAVVQGDAAFDFSDKSALVMTDELRNKLAGVFDFMIGECTKIDLHVTVGTLEQIKGDLLLVNRIPRQYAVGRIAGLEGTLRAEMETSLFLFVPSAKSKYYVQPMRDWEPAVSRFPKIAVDVTESSRCFACDRYAGAIFHALLIAEFGVIEVAKLFGVAGDKPGWGALERLERIKNKKYADRSDLEKMHFQFLENVVPLMVTIKDAWRHKITHVENKLVWMDTDFSPQIAEEVISTTRGFMRRLATDLPS
jgi:hypothetical protein